MQISRYHWNVNTTAIYILIHCRLIQCVIFFKKQLWKTLFPPKENTPPPLHYKQNKSINIVREIVAVYSKNHAEHNTTCGQHASSSNVTASCARGHVLRNVFQQSDGSIASTKANFQGVIYCFLFRNPIFSLFLKVIQYPRICLFLQTDYSGKVIMCQFSTCIPNRSTATVQTTVVTSVAI